MSSRIGVFIMLLILFVFKICYVSALTSSSDTTALQALKNTLTGSLWDWIGSDPCGMDWTGVRCNNSRVVSLSLSNRNLGGKLSGNISALSELQILDLSFNPNLTGPLPSNIGNLKKLTFLHLMGCGFSGQIPESIGDLEQLTRLSLYLNKFSGTIPASIGKLSKLDWFDITDNEIEGTIPVSNGSIPGLDMLLNAEHFHLGYNKLSGDIPEKLFSSSMSLLHVLFDGNQFTGKIPDSLGLVQNLTVIRLDSNRLSGNIPSSLNNLTNLNELYLANNMLSGSLPNLSSLNNLYTLDLSNNRMNFSFIPSWITSLTKLSTLRMEGLNLEGPIPSSLFSPPLLQTVILKRNQINATLDFGTNFSKQLVFVNLQNNRISDYKQGAQSETMVMLADNPVCRELGNEFSDYCIIKERKYNISQPPIKCGLCSRDRERNPKCRCVYPLKGQLKFRAPSFSAYINNTNFIALQLRLDEFFKEPSFPVESVAIRNVQDITTYHHLLIDVLVFPSETDRFNETVISNVISGFTTNSFKPPPIFGPYIFLPLHYDEPLDYKSSNTGIIIAAIVGSAFFILLLTIAGIYALMQKKRAERAKDQMNPFAKWDTSQSNVDAPKLMVAKAFTFEEMKKYANNFSEDNDVGGGGYGQVYKGILPSGQLIAIKRAQPGSLQGGLEFKTEIELLSRVHHKNVVRLLGFCYDRGEQMLVYEYIPNGSLRDSLSGKNGIRLDWITRLRIALGSGKGLAYLHELADPPIIHRDVKSSNILLDESLTAKVADFGLSQLVEEAEKANVTAQVKGTMGYLDPEYFMTNQLTEKSDVYGFGVVMLELVTGKTPIENGQYVVREVTLKINKSKKLYGLQEFLDATISGTDENLEGFENFVDLALRCVDHEGVKRPSMNEVVKEIENIMHHAGLNPNVDSATNLRTYEEVSKESGAPYGNNSFEYSASFPTLKLEPH